MNPTIDVRSLGYVVVDATDATEWARYGEDVLGLQAVMADDGSVGLKLDERSHRVLVRSAAADRFAAAGWELADARSLDAAADILAGIGAKVEAGTAEEAASRGVTALLRTEDPGGAVVEMYHGPVVDDRPFASPQGVRGFVTGTLGLGHVVLQTPAFAECRDFYRDVLGFRQADTMRLGPVELSFLHCNPRHHSLALYPGPESKLAHLMVEVAELDDVGLGLDRMVDAGYRIKQSIGRHSNDRMLSFYAATPGPFDIEYGWGAIEIDDRTWVDVVHAEGSLWGHRRPPRPAR
jgi:extradiol dioxygenase